MLLNNGRCCGLVIVTKLVNDMLLHLVIIQWCIEIHFALCKVAGLHLYVASRHLYKLFSPPPWVSRPCCVGDVRFDGF